MWLWFIQTIIFCLFYLTPIWNWFRIWIKGPSFRCLFFKLDNFQNDAQKMSCWNTFQEKVNTLKNKSKMSGFWVQYIFKNKCANLNSLKYIVYWHIIPNKTTSLPLMGQLFPLLSEVKLLLLWTAVTTAASVTYITNLRLSEIKLHKLRSNQDLPFLVQSPRAYWTKLWIDEKICYKLYFQNGAINPPIQKYLNCYNLSKTFLQINLIVN